MKKGTDRIIDLLIKKELSRLTDSEQSEFDAWLAGSQDNVGLVERLKDKASLSESYDEYVSIDAPKARRDMERRLMAGKRKRTMIRRMVWGASAAVAVSIAFFVINRPGMSPDSRIVLLPPSVPMLYVDGEKELSLENARIQLSGEKLIVIRRNGDLETKEIIADGYIKPINSTIVVPRGSTFDLELSDGSHVWLNAGSRLKYPVPFHADGREVELKGEAYFKVAEDKSRPFRVHSGRQTVEVLGTQFNVNAYSDDIVYTTLVKGSVAVSSDGVSEILSPDTQSVVSDDGITIRRVNTGHLTGWRHGMIVLEGRSLADIMSDLARWYDFEVTYNEGDLKDMFFRGAILRSDDLSQIFNVLRMTGEVDFTIKDNAVTVVRL